MKCPICDSELILTEDEQTGESWYYCPNPDCPNLEHYEFPEYIDLSNPANSDGTIWTKPK